MVSRLTRDATFKVKGVDLIPQFPTQSLNAGDRGDLWGAGWNPTFIDGQLNFIKNVMGANTVKIWGSICTTIPSNTVWFPRIQTVFNLCRKYGLKVYWTMQGGGEFTGGTSIGLTILPKSSSMQTNLSQLQTTFQFLTVTGADLIIGIDLGNELNLGYCARWSTDGTIYTKNYSQFTMDMQKYVAMARASTNLPLTFSIDVTGEAGGGGSNPWQSTNCNFFLDAQHDLALDFHDVHPYYAQTSVTSAATDFLNGLEKRAKFLGRHFVGENGGSGANAGDLTTGQTAVANHLTYLGNVARLPYSLGAILFGVDDFGSSPNFVYGARRIDQISGAVAERTTMTNPFRSWPGKLLE